jgi:hypothetical protein
MLLDQFIMAICCVTQVVRHTALVEAAIRELKPGGLFDSSSSRVIEAEVPRFCSWDNPNLFIISSVKRGPCGLCICAGSRPRNLLSFVQWPDLVRSCHQSFDVERDVQPRLGARMYPVAHSYDAALLEELAKQDVSN